MDVSLVLGYTTRSNHVINMFPSMKPGGQMYLIFWMKFNFVWRAPTDGGSVPFPPVDHMKIHIQENGGLQALHCSDCCHDDKHSLFQGPLPSNSLAPYTEAAVPLSWSLCNWRPKSGPQCGFTPPGSQALVAGHAASLFEVRTMSVAFILTAYGQWNSDSEKSVADDGRLESPL